MKEHSNDRDKAEQSAHQRKNRGKGRAKRVWGVIGTIVLVGVLTMAIFVGIFMTYINKSLKGHVEVDMSEYDRKVSTELYRLGTDGETWEMYQTLFSDENRIWVDIGDIPKYLQEAIEEASMCVQYVQGYQVDMPIFIDLEDVWDPDDGSGGRANNLSVSQRTSVARAFCDTVRSAGYKAGIYASYYYLLDRMHIGQLEGDNYIWMASYADSTSYPRSHDMWQYTDNGRVPGITTWDGRAASVDMNVWYE